ncbi:MAG TPA: thioesterase family protein [Trueperaceae bacterium]|nr:thioesterase family protein [Trueperaceae bacterium]
MRIIPSGFTSHHGVLVTQAMTVDFEVEDDDKLGALHPVYATYWLAKHMELVSRKIILPYLEDDEEGIGYRVEVDHLASALPGMRVDVIGVFDHQTGNRVHVRCQAVSELGDVIGRGATVQVILAKTRLDDNLMKLEQRWDSHREGRA